MTSWRRLSRDIDLLRIDLSAKEHVAEIRKLTIPVEEDGVAVGVVQWMNVDLVDGVAFSNHPDDYADGGWLQVLHSFPRPISVTAGNHLDVMIFVGLYRLVPSTLNVLTIVKPETVVRWHRAGFRSYWRWKSRRCCCRPTVPLEIRRLIREMSIANPLWGAPRNPWGASQARRRDRPD
jgi:hypothetical protein